MAMFVNCSLTFNPTKIISGLFKSLNNIVFYSSAKILFYVLAYYIINYNG